MNRRGPLQHEVQSYHTYLNDIGQFDRITPKEEVALAKRIQRGDTAAREKMIRANLRLVVKIAQDYAGLGLPLLDLISEGNIGLMKAVERFDPTKGAKLSTYAAWWIKQSIKRALANQSKTIRLPAHMVDKLSRMRKLEAQMTEQFGRAPTTNELAEAMEVKPGAIAHWKAVSSRPSSLDAPVGQDEGAEFIELIGDESAEDPSESLQASHLQDDVNEMIDQLDDRERVILKYRFGLDGAPVETLETVGERFQITRERVRQIQNLALTKVRRMIAEKDRPSFEEPLELGA